MNEIRPLAVVTGASSGIGYELARLAAEHGCDLVVAADDPALVEAVQVFKALGAAVEAVQADLSTQEGVDRLVSRVGDRPVEYLMANAGHGLGHGFLDQEWTAARHVVDTNVVGTLYLIHRIGRGMRARDRGRILITGSIAGLIPGTFQAVYNGSKAFLDNFAWALRNELKDTGVRVTCLMPGATDTDFFQRAGMLDTRVGASRHKADPADVARAGFDAMMRGDGDVVAGLNNKVQAAAAAVTPRSVLAERHRKSAEPGGAEDG